jgi:hypothetical protein
VGSEEGGNGPCGGVDPLRSGKRNSVSVRRAGYGGAPATSGVIIPIGEQERERERKEGEREKAKTLGDGNTTGSPGTLTVNRLGRAGLKEGADVAVGEDHRGGTMSQESDVTSRDLGRKGTVIHC